MKKLLSGIVLSLTVLSTTAIASVKTVYIYQDHGGYVVEFLTKKRYYESNGYEVEFHGPCESACTMYLGLPKDKLCVGPNAKFGFHKPYFTDRVDPEAVAYAEKIILEEYPKWVRKWIEESGGLKGYVKYLPKEIIKEHMKECA